MIHVTPPSGETLRVVFTGEIDLAARRESEEDIQQLLRQRVDQVLVDLLEVEFMDTSGIALLLEIAQTVGPIWIERANPIVLRAIDVLGLSEHLGVLPPLVGERTFSATASSIPSARRFFASLSADVPEPTMQEGMLLISELATNALVHGGTQFTVSVRHSRGSGLIHVQVEDYGAGKPVVKTPDLAELHGRGLLLVQRLSNRWGIIPDEVGKRIWFELTYLPSDGINDSEGMG